MPIPTITVVGNLTGDPELRHTQTGKPYTNLTVAANDRYKDAQTGEWKDGDTTFLRGTIWGPLAEAVIGLSKGQKVIVVGRLKQRDYEHEGQKRTTMELDVQEIGAAVKPARAAAPATTDSWPTAQPPTYDENIPF